MSAKQKPIYADVAVGRAFTDDDEEVKLAVPCLIHREAGIIWQSDPVPLGPYGLQAAGAVLKELSNTMRKADKDWNKVWKEIDWTIIGELGGGNRHQRRALGL